MFESTGRWTTTGRSVADVEQVSKLILLDRSNLELSGGQSLAIITLTTMVLFILVLLLFSLIDDTPN